MQVTKETWRMREQCVPGSLSSSPAQEPGNETIVIVDRHCYSASTRTRVHTELEAPEEVELLTDKV